MSFDIVQSWWTWEKRGLDYVKLVLAQLCFGLHMQKYQVFHTKHI